MSNGPAGGPASYEVVPVGKANLSSVSSSLAAAFEDDPVSDYLFPKRSSQYRRLRRYFTWQLRHVFLQKGEAFTTSQSLGGSLWMPSPRPRPTLGEALSQLAAVVTVLGGATSRALALVDALERQHPKVPHVYLGAIGTRPEAQGRGVGSALLRVVLDRLDEEGTPCYLESSKEENLSFYGRHGFEVTGEVGRTRGEGPKIWLMWREPTAKEGPA